MGYFYCDFVLLEIEVKFEFNIGFLDLLILLFKYYEDEDDVMSEMDSDEYFSSLEKKKCFGWKKG